MSKDTKHSDISKRLRAEIAAGVYGPGTRLPGEPQLVKRFGVSRPTIGRALQDLQNEGLIERRAGSGTYIRSEGQPAVATRLLGLLMPGLGVELTPEILCGEFATLARTSDYSILRGTSGPATQDLKTSLKQEEEICRQFIERRVTGVFFAPRDLPDAQAMHNVRLAESLHQEGIAVILLGRDLQPMPHRSEFDFVSVDHFAAGYMLAEHLLKMGCRRIGFVSRPVTSPAAQARTAGAVQALLQAGALDLDPQCIHVGDPENLKFVRSLMTATEVDAYFCATDHTALSLLKSFEASHTPMTGKIRVVGFDGPGSEPGKQEILTTVQEPLRDIASAAFHAMMERIAEPTKASRSFALNPTLMVRESCGAYLPQAGRHKKPHRRTPRR